MDKPTDTRPFNLEHAKAGAPIACRNGKPVQIFKWDGRQVGYPIVGVYGIDMPLLWTAAGECSEHDAPEGHDLVMLPLGHIDGKPLFVGDVLESDMLGFERITVQPTTRSFGGLRWPAPAKQYLVTQMTDSEIFAEYQKVSMRAAFIIHRHIANAALRHAIDAGQVVVPGALVHAVCNHVAEELNTAVDALQGAGWSYKADGKGGGTWTPPDRSHMLGRVNDFLVTGSKESISKVRALAERGAARDMAVAEAVKDACYVAVMNSSAGHEGTVVRQIDLAAIIAMVQP